MPAGTSPRRGAMPPELEERVKKFILRHRLAAAGETLVAAVSGGPDSVCLLHVLAGLRGELGFSLHIAHLDHQLRGEASAADAAYVGELARSLGIPATIEKRDVMSYKRERRISLEEAAREVRYTFLAEVASGVGARRAATGHTRDDDIETILLHLIRGSGTRGLRGLQPESRLTYSGKTVVVARPLLEVDRAETAAYCARHNLAPRLDASNLSLSPLRNRIRQELVPLLRKYNPRIADALRRAARIAADELDFISQAAGRILPEISRERDGIIELDRQGMLDLPPTLQRHLLFASLEKLLGTNRDIEMRHIEDMLGAVYKPAGKRLNLPGGIVFVVEYDKYIVCREKASPAPFPPLEGEFKLTIPGETRLPGWTVTAAFLEPAEMKREPDIFTAYLDAAAAGAELAVRARRRGDRFQPLGMSQPKKLGEFMLDARIPRSWRDRVPVVYSPVQILWVVGWRIDERAKVAASTRRVLRLQFKRS